MLPSIPCAPVSCDVCAAGDVAASIADVRAVEDHLQPADLHTFLAQLQQASILMLDANLCPETLEVGQVPSGLPVHRSTHHAPTLLLHINKQSFGAYSTPTAPLQHPYSTPAAPLTHHQYCHVRVKDRSWKKGHHK